jgi:hypothetical protein
MSKNDGCALCGQIACIARINRVWCGRENLEGNTSSEGFLLTNAIDQRWPKAGCTVQVGQTGSLILLSRKA